MADLDQGGVSLQRIRLDCGPTIGLLEAQIEKMPQRVVTVGGTTVLGPNDNQVLVNFNGAVTIQLPDVTAWASVVSQPIINAWTIPYVQGFDRTIFIKDFGRFAAAHPITVTPFAGQRIDNLAGPFSIVQNRQLLRLYPMGDLRGWFSG